MMVHLRKFMVLIFISLSMMTIVSAPLAYAESLQPIGGTCNPSTDVASSSSRAPVSFLGLPRWYKYLDGKWDGGDGDKQRCVPQLGGENGSVKVISIWLIALAVIEMLLMIAGIITVGMVIFGGIKYITSQGNSDETKNARGTIINAFIGLVITIIADISVNFIAKFLQ